NLDRLLIPFLQARDGRESDRQLDKLISEHAQPMIRGIVVRKWRLAFGSVGRSGQAQAELDIEDLQSDALGLLLGKLHEAKQHPDTEPIADFRASAAVIAYRACDMRLRQKYPSRWRLKSKIRYLLTHQHGLALWT